MTDQPPTGDRPEPGQPGAPEPEPVDAPAPEPTAIDTPPPQPAPAPPPVDAPPAEPVGPIDAPAPTTPPDAPEMGVAAPAAAAAVATPPTATPPAAPAAWQPPPEKPPSQPEVPGAPGRYFAATVTRVAALLIDGILLAIISSIIYAIVAAFVPGPNVLDDPTRFSAVSPAVIVGGIGGLIVSFLYFYFSWRSAGKATPGQRVFKMQVGNAFDGATLTGRQITIRWLTLFGPGFLAVVPALAGLGFLALIWDIVLLVTVITSATKQGLQDRWAGSAVVATGPQNTGLAWGCLLIFVIGIVLLAALVLAALVAIFAAFFSLN